jgi:hypothetical protein
MRRQSVIDVIVEDAIRELEAEFEATEGAEFDQPKTSSSRAYRWHKWQLFVAAAGSRTWTLKEESAPMRLGEANASDKHTELSIEWCRKMRSAGGRIQVRMFRNIDDDTAVDKDKIVWRKVRCDEIDVATAAMFDCFGQARNRKLTKRVP